MTTDITILNIIINRAMKKIGKIKFYLLESIVKFYKKDGFTFCRAFPLIFLILAGCFLRFYNLGNILFYGDESLHQIRISYQPLPFVLERYNGSAFFTLLVHFLLPLGKFEVMARLPSAVFGILTIVVIYLLGSALFSRRIGLTAAAFVAFSPFLIRHSQYSRAYALFVLLSLLALYFFLRAVNEKKTKLWGFFAVFTAIGTFNHIVFFLILPAYALFLGAEWLKGRLKRKKKPEGNAGKENLKKAILWMFAVVCLVFLLNLLDPIFRDFIANSAIRAKDQPADTSVSMLLINDILRTQIAPQSSYTPFYFFFLILVIIGLGAGFKKRFRETLLASLYMIIPYILFIAIKPREANVLSAYRYFIFILPVIFLFAAGGVVSTAAFLASRTARLKFMKPPRPFVEKFIAATLVILLAAMIGSSFRDYYVQFWRLGAFKPEKEVTDFLRKYVKRDALIYFDIFPASHLISVINPLDKRLKEDEIEVIIRRGFQIEADESDFLLYRIYKMAYEEYVAPNNADLWAVVPLKAESNRHLLSLAENTPGVEATRLREHTVIHFGAHDESIREKLAKMVALYLSLPLDESRRRHFHLLAAKAYLTVYDAEDGYRELDAFRKIRSIDEKGKDGGTTFVFKVFDRMFGLNHQRLRQIGEETILSEIQHLLFRFGNHYSNTGETEKALKAYDECSRMGSAFDGRISNRIASLAQKKASKGKVSDSLRLWEKAIQFDPGRKDARLLLAEAYRRDGRMKEAEEMYTRALGLASLPPQFFMQAADESRSVIIWEEDSAWHFLFLGQKGERKGEAVFTGNIAGSGKIKSADSICLDRRDSLLVAGDKSRFELRVKQGQAKAFSLKVPVKSQLTYDIRINGRRDADRIVFLGK